MTIPAITGGGINVAAIELCFLIDILGFKKITFHLDSLIGVHLNRSIEDILIGGNEAHQGPVTMWEFFAIIRCPRFLSSSRDGALPIFLVVDDGDINGTRLHVLSGPV